MLPHVPNRFYKITRSTIPDRGRTTSTLAVSYSVFLVVRRVFEGYTYLQHEDVGINCFSTHLQDKKSNTGKI